VESTYEHSKVIYGDTDSIMIRWPTGTTIQQAFDLGEKAADQVTALLRSQQGERGKDIQSNSAVRLTNE
jgi:DNA polymerase elongation subunit (family B)